MHEKLFSHDGVELGIEFALQEPVPARICDRNYRIRLVITIIDKRLTLPLYDEVVDYAEMRIFYTDRFRGIRLLETWFRSDLFSQCAGSLVSLGTLRLQILSYYSDLNISIPGAIRDMLGISGVLSLSGQASVRSALGWDATCSASLEKIDLLKEVDVNGGTAR